MIEVLARHDRRRYTRFNMTDLTRTARGGVSAAIVGLALAVVAITAGWLSAASYDGIAAANDCAGSCSSAAEAAAQVTPAPTAEPTPADPDGFPFISAQSIAVIEGSCGALLYGRDEHRKLPPASLTKLMTAAVATDQADVTTMITSNVDGAALNEATGSTIMGLTPGMTLSLLDLLYGLLLPSGNDAAIAIAEGIAGTEEKFVELMNAKARFLALDETNFTNSHGLYEDGLSSSAHNMAMLARYAMQNPDLREIVKAVQWQPAWDGPPLWNGNRLLTDYPGADGVKIGYTEESAQTIVASASREGRRIIVSLIHSQDRYTDSARLFDWSFAQASACP